MKRVKDICVNGCSGSKVVDFTGIMPRGCESLYCPALHSYLPMRRVERTRVPKNCPLYMEQWVIKMNGK